MVNIALKDADINLVATSVISPWCGKVMIIKNNGETCLTDESISDIHQKIKQTGVTNFIKLRDRLVNLANVESIKKEVCDEYNEYSLIILFDRFSELMICDSAKEVETLCSQLKKAIKAYKSQNVNNNATINND